MLITTYLFLLIVLIFTTSYIFLDSVVLNYIGASVIIVTYVSTVNYYLKEYAKGSLELYALSTIYFEVLLFLNLIKHWIIKILPLIMVMLISLLLLNQPIHLSFIVSMLIISLGTLLISLLSNILIGYYTNNQMIMVGFNLILLIPLIVLKDQIEMIGLLVSYLIIMPIVGAEVLRWQLRAASL